MLPCAQDGSDDKAGDQGGENRVEEHVKQVRRGVYEFQETCLLHSVYGVLHREACIVHACIRARVCVLSVCMHMYLVGRYLWYRCVGLLMNDPNRDPLIAD